MKFISDKPLSNWYGQDIVSGQPFEVPAELLNKAKATFQQVKPKKAKPDDKDGD